MKMLRTWVLCICLIAILLIGVAQYLLPTPSSIRKVEGIKTKDQSKTGAINRVSDDIPPVYYSVYGAIAAIDGDYLVVGDFNCLKVIDLKNKKAIKNIPVIPKHSPVTFDISGDIVAWSDLRNDSRDETAIGDVEKSNSDIFSFNIKTGQFRQITKDPAAQICPKIW